MQEQPENIQLGDLCLISEAGHLQEVAAGDPVIVIATDKAVGWWVKVLTLDGRMWWKRVASLRLVQRGGQYVETR